MAINLQKGQTIDLRKNAAGGEYDLSNVTIGLGWDVRKKSGGFFASIFGGGAAEDYDLDAIAFLLDGNDKVADRGQDVNRPDGRKVSLYGGDVIYFNSLKHPSGHIWLTGDNRTGEGDGDDEQIIVQLNKLDQKYQKIVFIVSIYQGQKNNQHFGMIDNAFIRAVDAKGTEIAKYSLSGNAEFNNTHSMIFAELYRREGSWKFRAIGEPRDTDNFVKILQEY
jgi:tellurium resistance protein TerD